jgi:Asp-tRNA(Asn)/Glu-tRNA(Gln) amidotransferase A subunit family amidase
VLRKAPSHKAAVSPQCQSSKNISLLAVIPISHHNDIAGPITKTVMDTAIILNVISETGEDYTRYLSPSAFRSRRIGVVRNLEWNPLFVKGDYKPPNVTHAALDKVMQVLQSLGADVIDYADLIDVEKLQIDELSGQFSVVSVITTETSHSMGA